MTCQRPPSPVQANLGYAYDLDVPFSEEDTGEEAIASFVGRYLNAARIGKDRLEQVGGTTQTRVMPAPCSPLFLTTRLERQRMDSGSTPSTAQP